MVGYGSLAISHYPGLRSIGYTTTFGIGIGALAALTLLSAMLVVRTTIAAAAEAGGWLCKERPSAPPLCEGGVDQASNV